MDDAELDSILDAALDDILDKEAAVAPRVVDDEPSRGAGVAASTPSTAQATPAPATVPGDEDVDVEQLSEQFQGMMATMQQDPTFQRMFQQITEQLEAGEDPTAVLSDLGARAAASTAPPTAAPPSSAPPTDDELQSSITETLRAIADSSRAGGAAAAPGQEGGDFDPASMEALLGQLSAMGDDPGFASVLEEFMGKMVSREALYEPLTQVEAQFPAWLEQHPDLSTEDRARYDAQLVIIRQILQAYDSEMDEKARFERIVGLLTEMQEYGQPPEDLMKDLMPGGFTPPDPGANPECSVM